MSLTVRRTLTVKCRYGTWRHLCRRERCGRLCEGVRTFRTIAQSSWPFPMRQARTGIENLFRANEEANRHHGSHGHRDRDNREGGGGGKHGNNSGNNSGGNNRSSSAAPGGKDKDNLPRFLELDVDCTNAYRRREVDADGKGWALAKSAAATAESGKEDTTAAAATTAAKKTKNRTAAPTDAASVRIPTRRCTVFVGTQSLPTSQPMSVLSAAVSSRNRVGTNCGKAVELARLLDGAWGIQEGLDDLLEALFPDLDDDMEGGAAADDEDVLGVAVEYLRRIHLFSYYTGRTVAEDVSDVLEGMHPAGTIHIRMQNADEILRKAEESRNPTLGMGGEEVALMHKLGEEGIEIEKTKEGRGGGHRFRSCCVFCQGHARHAS